MTLDCVQCMAHLSFVILCWEMFFYFFIFLIQLTIVLSMEGSSSGVSANEDFLWPILPVGILVPPPEINQKQKRCVNFQQTIKGTV